MPGRPLPRAFLESGRFLGLSCVLWVTAPWERGYLARIRGPRPLARPPVESGRAGRPRSQEGASPKMSNQPKRGLPSAFRPRNQRSWIARSTRSMPYSPGIQVIFAWRHV